MRGLSRRAVNVYSVVHLFSHLFAHVVYPFTFARSTHYTTLAFTVYTCSGETFTKLFHVNQSPGRGSYSPEKKYFAPTRQRRDAYFSEIPGVLVNSCMPATRVL